MTADERQAIRTAIDAAARAKAKAAAKAEREIERALAAAEATRVHCGFCGGRRCVCGMGDYIVGFDRDGRISYPAGVRPSQEVPV